MAAARTEWQHHYLDAANDTSTPKAPSAPGATGFLALGDGVTFLTEPFAESIEFTGPVTARLWISSSTTDADIFATRVFAPDGHEVVFVGASDTEPVTGGWLRASHRKLDEAMSTPLSPLP